jgi:hypothetical protein
MEILTNLPAHPYPFPMIIRVVIILNYKRFLKIHSVLVCMLSLLDSLCAVKNWVGAHDISLAGAVADPSWCRVVYLHGRVCSIGLWGAHATSSKPFIVPFFDTLLDVFFHNTKWKHGDCGLLVCTWINKNIMEITFKLKVGLIPCHDTFRECATLN